jgi:hypothetical protein
MPVTFALIGVDMQIGPAAIHRPMAVVHGDMHRERNGVGRRKKGDQHYVGHTDHAGRLWETRWNLQVAHNRP